MIIEASGEDLLLITWSLKAMHVYTYICIKEGLWFSSTTSALHSQVQFPPTPGDVKDLCLRPWRSVTRMSREYQAG